MNCRNTFCPSPLKPRITTVGGKMPPLTVVRANACGGMCGTKLQKYRGRELKRYALGKSVSSNKIPTPQTPRNLDWKNVFPSLVWLKGGYFCAIFVLFSAIICYSGHLHFLVWLKGGGILCYVLLFSAIFGVVGHTNHAIFFFFFFFFFFLINCWSSVVASVVLPQLCNLHCLFFL